MELCILFNEGEGGEGSELNLMDEYSEQDCPVGREEVLQDRGVPGVLWTEGEIAAA